MGSESKSPESGEHAAAEVKSEAAKNAPEKSDRSGSESDEGASTRENDSQVQTGDIPPFDVGKLTNIKEGKTAAAEALAVISEADETPPAGSAAEQMSAEELEQVRQRKEQAASIPGAPFAGLHGSATDSSTTGQHQHYRMLDSVLDQAPIQRHFKQTMIFDLLLALGLLLIVGGFTSGLMRIYITHMAKQSINQHNYKAAITILKKNPVPEFFSGFGNDPNDLLNQALYLDAMDKLEANPDDLAALTQLSKITPGSRFFHLAQEILREKSEPSSLQLNTGATHVASPEEMKVPKKPLFQEETDNN